MHKYPKVNYIGNKEKIVDWIISQIPIKEGKVLDLFAGGCSVSYALKKAGYEVISNDILYANYVIAKALISNESEPIDEKVFNISVDKKELGKIRKKLLFMEEKLFYNDEVDELAKLLAIEEKLNDSQKYVYLSILRRAMIRKLPYSRMNVPWEQIKLLRDEEYSYKKYKRRRAYHNYTFEKHMRDNLLDYNNAIFKGNKCEVTNMDVFELANYISYVDVIYMDPPYPSTMNNYDAFYGAFDEIFSKKKIHRDFTKKTSFLENLEELINTFIGKTKYIILSQNTKVKPSPESISNMLTKYGKLTVKEKKHNYQVTGKTNKHNNKELLFILKLYR